MSSIGDTLIFARPASATGGPAETTAWEQGGMTYRAWPIGMRLAGLPAMSSADVTARAAIATADAVIDALDAEAMPAPAPAPAIVEQKEGAQP